MKDLLHYLHVLIFLQSRICGDHNIMYFLLCLQIVFCIFNSDNICYRICIYIFGRVSRNEFLYRLSLFILLHLTLKMHQRKVIKFKLEPLAPGSAEPAIFGQVHPHMCDCVPWHKTRQEQQYVL